MRLLHLATVLLGLALALAPASATTLTATLSHDASASVSEPFLVAAQVAASSLSSSQVSVGVTLSDNTGGSFSISGATQTLTFTSNSTQTVTWSVTPVQAGTLQAPFTATAKVNGGSSSDTPGTATSPGAVTVSSRPVLDVACAPATTSPTPGVAVPVTCTLSNPTGRNVTNVRACLAAAGTTLTVTVTSALPTQAHTFVFTGIDNIVLPTANCRDVGTVGSVIGLGFAVTTVKNPNSPNNPPGPGPGGAKVEEKVLKLLDPLMGLLTLFIDEFQEHIMNFVSKGVQQVLSFTKTFLTEITFTTTDSITDVRLTAQQLTQKPKEVSDSPAGRPYRYFTVRTEKISEANLKEASITFKVAKSLLGNAPADQVRLQKYLRVGEGLDLAWKALPTTKTGEDDTYVYFKGITPGFSIFAIAGEQVPDARVSLFAVTLPQYSGVVPVVTGPEVSLPGPGAVPPGELITGGLSSTPSVGLGAVAIVGAAAVALLLLRRRQR